MCQVMDHYFNDLVGEVCESHSHLREEESSRLSEKGQSDRNNPGWQKDFSAANFAVSGFPLFRARRSQTVKRKITFYFFIVVHVMVLQFYYVLFYAWPISLVDGFLG